MESEGTRQEAITALLESAEAGGGDPIDRLWPLIYDDLRVLAHRQLLREQPGHTLVTTALVHEVYLKLADSSRVASRGRAYFFAAAARAMRQILVDHARARRRLKRGEGKAGPLSGADQTEAAMLAVDDFAAEILDLHEALEKLTAESPRAARVVESRFFGGMSVEETAEAIGVSPRTVKNDWALARAWLFRELAGRSE